VTDLYYDFRSIDYPIIDADAHVQEPPELWVERAPASIKDRVPRVEHREDGDYWLFDGGTREAGLGLTACAGKSYLQFQREGLRYEDLRPGMFETKARLADLDIDGIHAQVLYPSVTLGGAKTYADDPDLQRFCVRAYNEWLAEFCEQSDGRLVPQAIVPTTGTKDALEELHWALDHGHRGVILSRMPNGGFDVSPEDDTFFGLAEEAAMPVAVHIGSFLRDNPNLVFRRSDELAMLGSAGASKAGGHTIPVASDFIFAGIWEKFPHLFVVLVESNIGWIPTLLEQTDDMYLRYRWFTDAVSKMTPMPSEIFHRHFWATFMIDSVGLELRHRLNIDHLMWSTDYPHTGTDWPNSRVTLDRNFRGMPMAEVKKMTHDNAKALYGLDHIPDRLPI